MTRFHLTLALAFTLSIAYPAISHSSSLSCEDSFLSQAQAQVGENSRNIARNIDSIEKELAQKFKYQESIKNDLSKIVRARNILVKEIADPQKGLLAKRLLINEAKYTLDLTYYIFERDMSGYAILNDLKNAIARGVDVRLAVDSLGSLHPFHGELKALIAFSDKNAGFRHDPSDYTKLLQTKAKLKITIFNPINPFTALFQASANFMRHIHNLVSSKDKDVELYKDWGNRRSHDKIIIADAAFPELVVAINGGRNVGDDYYGVDENTFHDMEVVMKNNLNLPGFRTSGRNDIGPALTTYYENLVYHLGNKELDLNLIDKVLGSKKHLDLMDSHTAALENRSDFSQKYKQMQNPESHFMAPDSFYQSKWLLVHAMQNVLRHNVIRNPDLVKNEANKELRNFSDIMKHVRFRVSKAKKKIRIVSPYIYFEDAEVTELKDMLAKNPNLQLEIVTNSIMTSDNMMAQAYVDELVGPEFAGNKQVRIYEYGRLDAAKLGGTAYYGKLHAKFIVIDDDYTFVGTFNGDKRSRDLNSENMSANLSRDLALQLTAQFDNLKSQSTLFGSTELHQIRTSPKLGKTKRLISAHQEALYNVLRRLGMTWLI